MTHFLYTILPNSATPYEPSLFKPPHVVMNSNLFFFFFGNNFHYILYILVNSFTSRDLFIYLFIYLFYVYRYTVAVQMVVSLHVIVGN